MDIEGFVRILKDRLGSLRILGDSFAIPDNISPSVGDPVIFLDDSLAGRFS